MPCESTAEEVNGPCERSQHRASSTSSKDRTIPSRDASTKENEHSIIDSRSIGLSSFVCNLSYFCFVIKTVKNQFSKEKVEIPQKWDGSRINWIRAVKETEQKAACN